MCMCLLRKWVCLFSQRVNGMACCVYSTIISTDMEHKKKSISRYFREESTEETWEHFCNNLTCIYCIPSAVNKLTQSGFSILVCYHKRAIAAAWTALNVKISEQQSQRAPLRHSKPPFTPGVTGVGAWVVLRGQRAGLCAQHCMSTAITWNNTSTIGMLWWEGANSSQS